MATTLPKIDSAKSPPPPPTSPPENFEQNKSLLVIRRELANYVSNTLEEAKDRDSWAHQKLMHTLKEHEALMKAKKKQQARGQSFITENRSQAFGRNSPMAKHIIKFNNREKEMNHANEVVERRNRAVVNKQFNRLKHSSHHNDVARVRNEKLTNWVFQACSTNQRALKMRWLVALTIGARMQAFKKVLERDREKERAKNVFGSIALMSAKVNALAARRCQRIAADRILDFLQRAKANDSLWARCQGQVKRCIIRTQRRFRCKLQCHFAHVELIKRQYIRSFENTSNSEYDNDDNDDRNNNGHNNTMITMPSDEVFRHWVRERCRKFAIVYANWENFDVWPVLKETLENKPWLVKLDLHNKQTWVSPPRSVCVTVPKNNNNDQFLPDISPMIARSSSASTSSPRPLMLSIDHRRRGDDDVFVGIGGGGGGSAQEEGEEIYGEGGRGSLLGTGSLDSLNTPEQAISTHEKWGLLKNVVTAGNAFEEAGSDHSSSSSLTNPDNTKKKKGNKNNDNNNNDEYESDEDEDDDTPKVKIPLREEFAFNIRRMYRMYSFLSVYGDLRDLPAKPRMERLMTDRELIRFKEAHQASR